MRSLIKDDLDFAVQRLPRKVKKALMEVKDFHNKVFIGGGYLRSVIANEKVNDIDVFITTKDLTWCSRWFGTDEFVSENAITVKDIHPNVQVITRWLYETPEQVVESFDFTICCAAIWYNGTEWVGICDDDFYIDLAAKRLRYRNPVRNEDAGGSMLRVLKYYQRGYRIPIDSLADVISRIAAKGTDSDSIRRELRLVDPVVDPNHLAHFPFVEINLNDQSQENITT